MGFLDAFRFATSVAGRRPSGSGGGVRSPWTSSSLSSVAWADVFGTDTVGPVSRADAMRVPAIAKGRALICGTLARQPLAQFRGADIVTPAPQWITRTDTDQSPAERMLWTLDDLIFSGASLWAVKRDTRDRIVDARRIPPEWWVVDPTTLEILVNNEAAESGTVVLIQGPQDALLEIAADDVRAARAMTRAWSSRVTAPVPLVELHNTEANSDLLQEEIDALVDDWEASRASGGATAYTPSQIEVKVHGQAAAELFVEGRNASRLDFANYLNLPASLLEGSQATATLTYSTTEGRRNELVDYSLSYWAAPIEARLSMDDVTPRGTRVAFDLLWLSSADQPAQSPALED